MVTPLNGRLIVSLNCRLGLHVHIVSRMYRR